MAVLPNVHNALEQLWSHKMRSLLTVLGIIIAVTSTITVVGVAFGVSGRAGSARSQAVRPAQSTRRTVTRLDFVRIVSPSNAFWPAIRASGARHPTVRYWLRAR